MTQELNSGIQTIMSYALTIGFFAAFGSATLAQHVKAGSSAAIEAWSVASYGISAAAGLALLGCLSIYAIRYTCEIIVMLAK